MAALLEVGLPFETIAAIRKTKNIEDAISLLTLHADSEADRAIAESARAIVKAVKEMRYDITRKTESSQRYTKSETSAWDMASHVGGWGNASNASNADIMTPSHTCDTEEIYRNACRECGWRKCRCITVTFRDLMFNETVVKVSDVSRFNRLMALYSESSDLSPSGVSFTHDDKAIDYRTTEFVGSLGIKDGSVITVGPRESNQHITLTLCDTMNHEESITLRNDAGVSFLAELYSQRTGLPLETFELVYNGISTMTRERMRADGDDFWPMVKDGDLISVMPKEVVPAAPSRSISPRGCSSRQEGCVCSECEPSLEPQRITVTIRDAMHRQESFSLHDTAQMSLLADIYALRTGLPTNTFDFEINGKTIFKDSFRTLAMLGIAEGTVIHVRPRGPAREANHGWGSSAPRESPLLPVRPVHPPPAENMTVVIRDARDIYRAIIISPLASIGHLLDIYNRDRAWDGCNRLRYLGGNPVLGIWGDPYRVSLKDLGIVTGICLYAYCESTGWD